LSLLEKYKIYIFLTKFKSNLKVKILDIDSVLDIRDKLLIITIMQKQTLNRIREANASNFNDQQITKNFDVSSSKFY